MYILMEKVDEREDSGGHVEDRRFDCVELKLSLYE